jgi:hypothetical protein
VFFTYNPRAEGSVRELYYQCAAEQRRAFALRVCTNVCVCVCVCVCVYVCVCVCVCVSVCVCVYVYV